MAALGYKLDDGRLVQAWRDWERHYRDLQIVNPVLDLWERMGLLAESHESSSWLSNRENGVRDWVDAGADPARYPFDDRWDLVTPAFCQRMIQLRRALRGWVRMDAANNLVLYGDGDGDTVT